MTALDNVLVGQHVHFKSSLFANAFALRKVREEERRGRERVQDILKFAYRKNKALSHRKHGDSCQTEGKCTCLADEAPAGANPQMLFIRSVEIRHCIALLTARHTPAQPVARTNVSSPENGAQNRRTARHVDTPAAASRHGREGSGRALAARFASSPALMQYRQKNS